MGVNPPSTKTHRATQDPGGVSKRGFGPPCSCCGPAARSASCPAGAGRVSTQGASFPNRTSKGKKRSKKNSPSAHGRLTDHRDRGSGASLSVGDDKATRGWRRTVREASGGTVLARPEAQLSGRARGVVLVANDAAKRRSGCLPRHLSMPSLNSTSRVRPVRSPGGFGQDL